MGGLLLLSHVHVHPWHALRAQLSSQDIPSLQNSSLAVHLGLSDQIAKQYTSSCRFSWVMTRHAKMLPRTHAGAIRESRLACLGSRFIVGWVEVAPPRMPLLDAPPPPLQM